MIEHFLVLREMNAPDGIVIFSKPILETKLVRKRFTGQVQLGQRLMHSLGHHIVGQACSQPIDRLQRVNLLLILPGRIEDFRVLHRKAALAACNPASKYDLSAPRERVPQKRHPKPDCLDGTGQIFDMDGRHLHITVSRYLDSSEDSPGHRLDLSFLHFADRYRIFIDIIASGIIPD